MPRSPALIAAEAQTKFDGASMMFVPVPIQQIAALMVEFMTASTAEPEPVAVVAVDTAPTA